MTNFFFITTYDDITSSALNYLVNTHPDIHCKSSPVDPFLNEIYQVGNDYIDASLDLFISNNLSKEKKYSGNIQRYTAFELQHKTIMEKCKFPHRKANIYLHPQNRIEFILQGWLTKQPNPEALLQHINSQLSFLKHSKHPLFSIYYFDYFYKEIQSLANKIAPHHKKSAINELFLIALTKVIAFESADFPIADKVYNFNTLISEANYFLNMLSALTRNKLSYDQKFTNDLNDRLASVQKFLDELQPITWEKWYVELLNECLTLRFKTIYYPHLDKSLSSLYSEKNCKDFVTPLTKKKYSKLISIQLNSNRPAQISAYFDNLEETTTNLNMIEVLVNIDQGDETMEALLKDEIKKRKFTIKYICSPRPASFCELWKPINNLLAIRDPSCYFMLNISDEMFFITKGWDEVLEKYVGFFPDDLFRLRASRNKLRVQYDRWECSFAQDSIPITTRRWVEVGGDWNPCFGPDSFQQLVSFYLTKDGSFSNEHYSRDIPILDIQFAGDIPAMGISPEKAWAHVNDHLKAMQICQSYKMQLEAKKRAMLIKAHIIAHKNQLKNFGIKISSLRKQIKLIDKIQNKVVDNISYKISWLSIIYTNNIRKLRFFCYFGDGFKNKPPIWKSFLKYLYIKHKFLYILLNRYSKNPIKKRVYNIKKILEENKRLQELYLLAKFKNEEHFYDDTNKYYFEKLNKPLPHKNDYV